MLTIYCPRFTTTKKALTGKPIIQQCSIKSSNYVLAKYLNIFFFLIYYWSSFMLSFCRTNLLVRRFDELLVSADEDDFLESLDMDCHLFRLRFPFPFPKSIPPPPLECEGLFLEELAGFNCPIATDNFSKRVINFSILSLADLNPEKEDKISYKINNFL